MGSFGIVVGIIFLLWMLLVDYRLSKIKSATEKTEKNLALIAKVVWTWDAEREKQTKAPLSGK